MPVLRRSLAPERMDASECAPAEIEGALRDIALVNRWLGGTRALLHALEPYLAAARAGGLLEVLDVGTGSADLAAAMEAHGRRRGLRVQVTAVERGPVAARAAARVASATRDVRVVIADARALPFADRSFDVVTASMFLHHFDEPAASSLLVGWARLARRAVIVNDLERGALPWAFIAIAARATRRSPLFVHDAPLSVRRGFTARELVRLAHGAGSATARVERLWPFRLALTLPVDGGRG